MPMDRLEVELITLSMTRLIIKTLTWSMTTIRYAISTRDGISLDPAKADEELQAIGDEILPDPDTLGWENLDNEARHAVITNIVRKTVLKAAEVLGQ